MFMNIFSKTKKITMRRVALFYIFAGLHGRQLDSQICCNSTCCTVSRKSHCMFMKEWKRKKANILLILLWKEFWLCKHPETSGEPWGVHKPQFESHCLEVLEWSIKDFPQQQNKIKLRLAVRLSERETQPEPPSPPQLQPSLWSLLVLLRVQVPPLPGSFNISK